MDKFYTMYQYDFYIVQSKEILNVKSNKDVKPGKFFEQ